jgi:hypothetical protein
MRFLPAVLLSIAFAAPSFAAPGQEAAVKLRAFSGKRTLASNTPVVPWRPHAWRPASPVLAAAAAGVRSDPVEPGAPIAPELASAMAAHRAALAAVPVVRRADGSRSAVLGGLARRWTVVDVGSDGTLRESCVTTEAQARARVDASRVDASRKER